MRRVVLALLPLLLLGLPVAPGRAASPCLVGFEVRNQWSLAATKGTVAMADGDPCRLLRVGPGTVASVSDDGGLSWTVVGDAPEPAASLVASDLPDGHALMVSTSGHAFSTPDRGRSWRTAGGLPGAVRTLVTDETTSTHVLAVLAPSGPSLPVALPVGTSGSLYESTDGGVSFTPVDGALTLAVTAVAVDAGVPSRWWAGVAGPAGGLFLTDDAGTTFTRVASGEVRAIATSRLPGGGSEVVAATDGGVVVSRDGGKNVDTRLPGTDLTDVAVEWQHPSALMLLGGSVRRSSDTGVTARGQADGLPAGCAATDLRRDRSIPSVFLTTCADGSTWRYRSDGRDLSDTDRPDASTPNTLPPVGGPLPVSMRELARHALPSPGSRIDGTLAYDGAALYYTDRNQPGLVHRVVAATGKELPDLRIGVPRAAGQIAYDANRNHLLVLDVALEVWDVDLVTGKAKRLFHAPITGNSEEQDEQNDKNRSGRFYGGFSYDSATDRMLFAEDGSDGFVEYDREGHERNNCARLGLAGVVNANVVSESSIAGLVATGDGLVYIEAEDDATVVRVDRSCHVLATFSHESFSEAPAENDALACDTTSFGTAAVWLRDAKAGRVVAYSVQSGYCALPSRVTVSAPPGVATGQSGTVCARLVQPAKHLPLPDVPVDLLVAGRGIGSPVTDANGRACAEYRPLAREAGAGKGTSTAKQPVVAAFLGTPAFRPSSAQASLVVSRAVPLPPAPPAPPAVDQPAPAPAVVVPLPPPPVQPPPPPPNVPQQNPIQQPQGHPGAQPGAMGALGAAPMPEDEEEAAVETGAETSTVHRMVGLYDGAVLPYTAALALGWVVHRRRRASRVRPQS